MVLEATVICVDNSEWMRNGDYSPSRFQSQADAVNLICGAKTQSNPENTVGVLTMAGKGVRVLVTPTADLGKILSSMHGVEIGGNPNLASGVQVAQLALKHRQNKNQRQRIVLFSGSPVEVDSDSLVRIGKKLKKNNVALDIVSFGQDDPVKEERLQALMSAVNSNDNSHLVKVPPGENSSLSDILISSPIFTGDGEGNPEYAAAVAGAAVAQSGGASSAGPQGVRGTGYEFGVDPNLDPELALALRVSMEEERARQEQAALKAEKESGEAEGAAVEAPAPGGESSQAAAALMEDMSAAGLGVDSLADDEEDELALALKLSMQEAGMSSELPEEEADVTEPLDDPDFIQTLLDSLPGVDTSDPDIQRAFAELQEAARKAGVELPEDDEDSEDTK